MDILTTLYNYLFSYIGMGTLGVIMCVILAMVLYRLYRLEPVRFLFLYIISIPAVFCGAKCFGILSFLAYALQAGFSLTFRELINNAGIVYYGGVFAYLLFMKLVLPVFYKAEVRLVRDIASLLIPLFHGFARFGCYCAHCCYGVVSELDVFSRFFEHRVPVQLIEACFELILFLVLGFLLVRNRLGRVTVARLYLYAYSPFRFIIEFFRGDLIRGIIGPFSFSQWIALGTLAVLFITHFRKEGTSL